MWIKQEVYERSIKQLKNEIAFWQGIVADKNKEIRALKEAKVFFVTIILKTGVKIEYNVSAKNIAKATEAGRERFLCRNADFNEKDILHIVAKETNICIQ